MYINKLYKIEKEAREQGLSTEQLYGQRQSKAIPILTEFKNWLDVRVEKVPPNSLLGKAINYTLGQCHRLIQYITEGIIRPDNNLVENAIRPFVIGRKNWLFSDTVQGAEANSLEPYWFLKHLFQYLPEAMTRDDFQALLPYNMRKEKIYEAAPC